MWKIFERKVRQSINVIFNLIEYIFIQVYRIILETKYNEATDTAIMEFMRKKRCAFKERFYEEDDFRAFKDDRTFIDKGEKEFISEDFKKAQRT